VLSDIPWELVCPELFELFPDLGFYDYTKVPGRTGFDNYDLTFSFSGTNERQTKSEIARGHRVAVVYWLPNTCYKSPQAKEALIKYYAGKGPRPDCEIVTDMGLTVLVPAFRDRDTGAIIVAATPDQLGAGMVFEDTAATLVEVT
jgi:hypothetical protein